MAVSTHVMSLAPEQRRRFLAQVRQDRDLLVGIWKDNPRASRTELEFLYWELGGEAHRFNACLHYASELLMWEDPE